NSSSTHAADGARNAASATGREAGGAVKVLRESTRSVATIASARRTGGALLVRNAAASASPESAASRVARPPALARRQKYHSVRKAATSAATSTSSRMVCEYSQKPGICSSSATASQAARHDCAARARTKTHASATQPDASDSPRTAPGV